MFLGEFRTVIELIVVFATGKICNTVDDRIDECAPSASQVISLPLERTDTGRTTVGNHRFRSLDRILEVGRLCSMSIQELWIAR
jgi:hypothetical protein